MALLRLLARTFWTHQRSHRLLAGSWGQRGRRGEGRTSEGGGILTLLAVPWKYWMLRRFGLIPWIVLDCLLGAIPDIITILGAPHPFCSTEMFYCWKPAAYCQFLEKWLVQIQAKTESQVLRNRTTWWSWWVVTAGNWWGTREPPDPLTAEEID